MGLPGLPRLQVNREIILTSELPYSTLVPFPHLGSIDAISMRDKLASGETPYFHRTCSVARKSL